MTYYNFKFDGKEHDIEANTIQEAREYADTWWQESHEGEDIGYIIGYDDGKQVSITTHFLEYDDTPSDFEQHNTRYI